jgi:glycosyltransferase involved in cell wall biosynthesis
MRLCYVANPNLIHVHRWTRYFAERGHDVHLIGESPAQRPVPHIVRFYDLTSQVNIRKIRYLPWARAVRNIVHRLQPDVLHAHQVSGAGWLGAAAAYHPFLVTAWGSDLLVGAQRSWMQRQLARWVLRRADHVTCVSNGLADAALALGADPARLEVAPWGIDTAAFHPGPANDELRQQLGLGPGPVVLSIRALHPVYNPLDIARAIPRVLHRVPDAQFVIRTYSHDPHLLAKFRAMVHQHGASDAVHYVGELADDDAIAELYRLADVAISVPSSDGTPMSVLEAMACGVAPVLTDLPSLRDWVQDGREGLFVPVGDIEALSAAIVRLLTDATEQRRLQRQGIRLVQERAQSGVWMAHAEALYRALAGGGRS